MVLNVNKCSELLEISSLLLIFLFSIFVELLYIKYYIINYIYSTWFSRSRALRSYKENILYFATSPSIRINP